MVQGDNEEQPNGDPRPEICSQCRRWRSFWTSGIPFSWIITMHLINQTRVLEVKLKQNIIVMMCFLSPLMLFESKIYIFTLISYSKLPEMGPFCFTAQRKVQRVRTHTWSAENQTSQDSHVCHDLNLLRYNKI